MRADLGGLMRPKAARKVPICQKDHLFLVGKDKKGVESITLLVLRPIQKKLRKIENSFPLRPESTGVSCSRGVFQRFFNKNHNTICRATQVTTDNLSDFFQAHSLTLSSLQHNTNTNMGIKNIMRKIGDEGAFARDPCLNFGFTGNKISSPLSKSPRPFNSPRLLYIAESRAHDAAAGDLTCAKPRLVTRHEFLRGFVATRTLHFAYS